MTTTYAYTRELLDRMLVELGQPRIQLVCSEHPDKGTRTLYQDGHVRVLCAHCGFTAFTVKVAMAGEGR